MNIFVRPKFLKFSPQIFVIWAEAIVYKNKIINENWGKIHFLQFAFIFSNVVSILTSSKLDNDFIRYIIFQPVTVLNLWWVNFCVQLIENFEGSFFQIIVTNVVWTRVPKCLIAVFIVRWWKISRNEKTFAF